MILIVCDRRGCPSQHDDDSEHLKDWLVVHSLDEDDGDHKHYCGRDCAIQDMANYEIPETMPHA